jgi:hypothetical protein
MESAKGAVVIEYGHKLPAEDGKLSVPALRKQAFVLPLQVDMKEETRMVFSDRLGHRASMQPGGALQILPLDF